MMSPAEGDNQASPPGVSARPAVRAPRAATPFGLGPAARGAQDTPPPGAPPRPARAADAGDRARSVPHSPGGGSRKHLFLRCCLRFGLVLGLTLCAGLRFLRQQAGMEAIHAEKRSAAQFEYVGHAG